MLCCVVLFSTGCFPCDFRGNLVGHHATEKSTTELPRYSEAHFREKVAENGPSFLPRNLVFELSRPCRFFWFHIHS
jgi:hypothetical protein